MLWYNGGSVVPGVQAAFVPVLLGGHAGDLFEVAGESVDLTTLLPGIDPAKVTIVSGGILEGNMLSGYANGTPVVYTYDFGQVKNQAELRVTLNITFEEKAEAVVFASVNGISAEGESLQAAIESSGITAEDVKELAIES